MFGKTSIDQFSSANGSSGKLRHHKRKNSSNESKEKNVDDNSLSVQNPSFEIAPKTKSKFKLPKLQDQRLNQISDGSFSLANGPPILSPKNEENSS